MVGQVTRPLGLKDGEKILECGCGAGAFLASLLKKFPELKVTGLDYSQPILAAAKRNVKGDFYHGDMTDLSIFSDGQFEKTISYSTFHYLSSEGAAARAVREMVRVTRAGGSVFIGDVSDLAKREMALALRKMTHQNHQRVSSANTDHLFVPQELFRQLAGELKLGIDIIDQESFDLPFYDNAKYRYSVYLRKNSGRKG
jgi:ubiquinone/menaquinone biosynthesis C-methylase UbiE